MRNYDYGQHDQMLRIGIGKISNYNRLYNYFREKSYDESVNLSPNLTGLTD